MKFDNLKLQFAFSIRYELYRYHYDRSNISHSPSITMGTIGHHGAPIHMVPHGYLSGGHHQSGGIVQSTHQLHDVSGELSGNKRPRLTIDTRASIHQPLVIDTRDNVEVKKVKLNIIQYLYVYIYMF